MFWWFLPSLGLHLQLLGVSHSWLLLHKWQQPCTLDPQLLWQSGRMHLCQADMHFQKLYPQLTTASEPEVCSLLQIQSVGSLGYWRMNIGVGNMLTLALQALFSNVILDRQLQSEKTVFTSCQADTWAFFSAGLWVVPGSGWRWESEERVFPGDI